MKRPVICIVLHAVAAACNRAVRGGKIFRLASKISSSTFPFQKETLKMAQNQGNQNQGNQKGGNQGVDKDQQKNEQGQTGQGGQGGSNQNDRDPQRGSRTDEGSGSQSGEQGGREQQQDSNRDSSKGSNSGSRDNKK
jgi:hypothetical protein